MLSSVSKTAMDWEQRMNNRGESLNDEVRSRYELFHGQIRTLTEVVQYSNNHIESLRSDVTAFHAQIKCQSDDV
jgi:DNA-directed RNA polymerase alpha subunit